MKAIFAIAILTAASAFASDSTLTAPHVTISLIAHDNSIQRNHDAWIALRFQMEKGWHVYWLNPGDSGEPPRVQWELPLGITAGPIQWPAPRRISLPPLMNFGYEDEVVFPIHLQTSTKLGPSDKVALSAAVRWVICREVCIPGKGQLSLSIPVSNIPPTKSPNGSMIAGALTRIPKPAPSAWDTHVVEAKDDFILMVAHGKKITQAEFFPAEDLQIENAAPQKLETSSSGFRLSLKKSEQYSKPFSDLNGVLVVSGKDAYTISVAVKHPRTNRPPIEAK